MPLVVILGLINAFLKYRDMFRAFGPHQIPICKVVINQYRNFDYLNSVFDKCDILLLQETWLHNFQFNEFTNVLNNCNYHAVTAMDKADIGRVGRPFGGCAFVWHRD